MTGPSDADRRRPTWREWARDLFRLRPVGFWSVDAGERGPTPRFRLDAARAETIRAELAALAELAATGCPSGPAPAVETTDGEGFLDPELRALRSSLPADRR